MKLKGVLIAAVLLTPTAALAAPGMVTASVGLRAGPGPGFPMVDRIPAGAQDVGAIQHRVDVGSPQSRRGTHQRRRIGRCRSP